MIQILPRIFALPHLSNNCFTAARLIVRRGAEPPEGEEPGDTEGAGGGELADTQEMVFVLNNEPDAR